jgi:hypothetical protein
MGIFSSIKQTAQKLVDKVVLKVGESKAQKFVDVGNKVLTVITSPIQSISNFKKAEEQTAKKSTGRLIAETLETTITTGLVAVAPFTSAGKTALAKVGSVAFGSIPKFAVSTTVLGAVASSPTVRETVASTLSPVNLFTTGQKIGNVIEGLPETSKEGASKLATGIALGLGGVALVGAGALVVDKVGDFLEKDKGGILGTDDTIPPQPLTTKVENPILPETQTIKAGTITKRKKRRTPKKKMEALRISQRVNVLVNQSNRKVYKGVHTC